MEDPPIQNTEEIKEYLDFRFSDEVEDRIVELEEQGDALRGFQYPYTYDDMTDVAFIATRQRDHKYYKELFMLVQDIYELMETAGEIIIWDGRVKDRYKRMWILTQESEPLLEGSFDREASEVAALMSWAFTHEERRQLEEAREIQMYLDQYRA